MTAYGTSLTAGYMGDSLRAWKQDSLGNRTYFVYDGTNVIGELNATGSLGVVYTWGANGLLSRHTSSTGTLYYTYDPTGSVATVTNSSAVVQGDEVFDATGKRLNSYSSRPVSFCGQWGYYDDAETGLILCGHRYYDSFAGRFINRDPIGFDGGINVYGYCRNSFINKTDPDGTSPLDGVCLYNLADCIGRAIIIATFLAGPVYTNCMSDVAQKAYDACLPVFYAHGRAAFYKCVDDATKKAEPGCAIEESKYYEATLKTLLENCALQYASCIGCGLGRE